jgi:predicted acyltransferase
MAVQTDLHPEPPLSTKPPRLESLDVFRGITIAAMVLVNNPGTWGKMYNPLEHAQWDGCTPTDLIFPFFLFIVGVAMTFSFDRRIAKGDDKVALMAGVAKRALLLILLGFILTGFPNLRLVGPYILLIAGLDLLDRQKPLRLFAWPTIGAALLWFTLTSSYILGQSRLSAWIFWPPSDMTGGYMRIPGVLQRIGLAFFLAAVIMLFTGVRGRIRWCVGILLGYWALLMLVPAPAGYAIGMGGGKADAPAGALFSGTLNDWIDVECLGKRLYSARPDPEGLLSTIPSVVTVLLGTLLGAWLHRPGDPAKKWLPMLMASVPLILVGILWSVLFPLNKKIWSSSFVVYTAGWGTALFAVCYYLNDVRGWRGWSFPFLVFGTNAILVFFGSGMMARIMGATRWLEMVPDDKPISWRLSTWIYKKGFEGPIGEGELSSFLYSVCFLVVWLGITYPLFRNKIFLKV